MAANMQPGLDQGLPLDAPVVMWRFTTNRAQPTLAGNALWADSRWIGWRDMADSVGDAFDGLAIARGRIAEEARRRSGTLDLCNLGLQELPEELFKLRHLRTLHLGDGIRRDDGEWVPAKTGGSANRVEASLGKLDRLPELRELSLAGSFLEDLGAVAKLRQLRALDVARTQVGDFTPLGRLSGLRRFDCSGTQINDLRPVTELNGLEALAIANTPVMDLAPLAGMATLRQLDCSSTDVEDLAPVARVKDLRRLDCSYTRVGELGALAPLVGLQHLACASTGLRDLTPITRMPGLERFDCCYTQVEDLALLSGLTGLRWVHCSGTPVSSLAPLAALGGLQVLFCSDTSVADLAPLSGLRTLRALECSHTQISSLAPLSGLPMLQVLHCSGTQVADLGPLAALSALQVLYFSNTPVSSLAPLAGLTALQVLSCAHTQVNSLAPLAGLPELREFSCADTPVTDLRPLTGISGLQWFSCASTPVRDLMPLTGKSALRWVSCASSEVSDLTPMVQVPALEWLDGSDCRLTLPPEEFTRHPSLRELYLYRSSMDHVPAEVLSQTKRDNCLASLRAHFIDLVDGAETVPDVKLIILGNGRVGKTQLSRKLRNEDFQHHWDSTHGIAVRPGDLAQADGSTAARLQIWDFGGQDIYHGTHTLFLRTRAVFVLAWATDVEDTPEYEHQGIRFRNHPLAYWAEYVRQFGDRDSPVMIVQTKCDTGSEDVQRLPVPEDLLSRFGYLRQLTYSSATDRGRGTLNATLCEAIDWLRQKDGQGNVITGAGRARVRRKLEALRDEDAALPPTQRKYRTIERDAFLRICEEAGGVTSVDHLLGYLNNAGVIFFRKGLFNDRIILDQAWALDAIYAVFQRDKCYRQLQQRQGRFDRKLLESLVWQEYSVAEQRLFLSMMLSCGICFIHRRGPGGEDAIEYIAPDLLGDRALVEAQLGTRRDAKQAVEEESFSYTLLPPGLLRGLIARVGTLAGTNAVYWRDGVTAYETSLRSHAFIEQETHGGWGGKITLRAQGGDAAALLKRLVDWVEEEHDAAGLDPSDVARAGTRPVDAEDDMIGAASMAAAKAPPLVFGPPPAVRGM